MLLGEDLGGGQKEGLEAVEMSNQRGHRGDDGFSRADVTFQKTIHGMGGGEIGKNFSYGLRLRGSEGERQRGNKSEHLFLVDPETVEKTDLFPGKAAAQRGELEEKQLVEGQTPAGSLG